MHTRLLSENADLESGMTILPRSQADIDRVARKAIWALTIFSVLFIIILAVVAVVYMAIFDLDGHKATFSGI